jgi:hypothetical protein
MSDLTAEHLWLWFRDICVVLENTFIHFGGSPQTWEREDG